MTSETDLNESKELLIELLVMKILLNLNKVRTWQHAQLFCNATYNRQLTQPLLSEILEAEDTRLLIQRQLEHYFTELMLQIRDELCLLCSETGRIRFVTDVNQKLRAIICRIVQRQNGLINGIS